MFSYLIQSYMGYGSEYEEAKPIPLAYSMAAVPNASFPLDYEQSVVVAVQVSDLASHLYYACFFVIDFPDRFSRSSLSVKAEYSIVTNICVHYAEG